MADAPPPAGTSLPARLAEARRRMASLDLPAPVAARLQRRFIAVCDSVKAAGADEQRGERRLAAFLAALDRAAESTGEEADRRNSGRADNS